MQNNIEDIELLYDKKIDQIKIVIKNTQLTQPDTRWNRKISNLRYVNIIDSSI